MVLLVKSWKDTPTNQASQEALYLDENRLNFLEKNLDFMNIYDIIKVQKGNGNSQMLKEKYYGNYYQII
jgi:hypothetical protein